jgi:GGDEF domain-containing protein
MGILEGRTPPMPEHSTPADMTHSELTPAEHHKRLTSPPRLAALQSTGLLNGTSDPVLDRLARLTTALLGVPIALVSLVDDRAQHFPGLEGLGGWAGEGRGTPLSHSFCQHVVTRDSALFVQDAATHELVRGNLAFKELGVVAYAGVPLRTADGETLGALCAIDTAPKVWTAEQVAALDDLAAAAMAEIELRATTRALLATQERLRAQTIRDELTGLLNRRGFAEHAGLIAASAERNRVPFVVLALDLDGFKEINDTHGHDAGDEALVEMAAILSETFRASDVVARMGGDEFLVVATNTTAELGELARERLLGERRAGTHIPAGGQRRNRSLGCARPHIPCQHPARG